MKIYRILLISLTLLLGMSACSDESLNPLPDIEKRVGLIAGEFTKPVTSSGDLIPFGVMHMGSGETMWEADITSPQDNVDVVYIYGRIATYNSDPLAIEYSDTKLIKTITDIPSHVTLSAEEIAVAFDMSIEDFTFPNSQFFYFNFASESNGETVDLNIVTGAGFSSADNPDGISSGLTFMYQDKGRYFLVYP